MSQKNKPITICARAAPVPTVCIQNLLHRGCWVGAPVRGLFRSNNLWCKPYTLTPRAVSALRHRHAKQDEFVYIREGFPTVHTDEGRMKLSPAMCAGFKANAQNGHCLYLEIGDRTPGDERRIVTMI
jgi:uncharacterized cupin superfamily protein